VIWKFIENLKHQGRSILMTTHSMNEAEMLSDRYGALCSKFITQLFGFDV